MKKIQKRGRSLLRNETFQEVSRYIKQTMMPRTMKWIMQQLGPKRCHQQPKIQQALSTDTQNMSASSPRRTQWMLLEEPMIAMSRQYKLQWAIDTPNSVLKRLTMWLRQLMTEFSLVQSPTIVWELQGEQTEVLWYIFRDVSLLMNLIVMWFWRLKRKKSC